MVPRRLLFTILLVLPALVTSQQGYAQFTENSSAVSEAAEFAVVAVERVSGTSGVLEAQVYVVQATAGAGYSFQTTTVRWADGDESYKPVVVRVLDDNSYEPREAVWLAVNDTNPGPPPFHLLRTTKVSILPDDDGGRLEFTFDAPGAKPQSLVTYPALAKEGPSDLCLVYAGRKGGRSGQAGVKLELVDCELSIEVSYATESVDFDYYPASEEAVWEDGESSRRCLAYALFNDAQSETLESYQVGIRVWQDADLEPDELICLRVHAMDNTTAFPDTRLIRILIQDQREDGAGVTECTKGVNCVINLTDLHYDPGEMISLQKNCQNTNCSNPSWGEVTNDSYVQVVPASLSLTADSGDYFVCRCFNVTGRNHIQAIKMVYYEGPSDINFAYCVLGWPGCTVTGLMGAGSPNPNASLRIMATCPVIGQPFEVPQASSLWDMMTGGVSNQTEQGAYPMADAQAMSAAGAGLYDMCWCKREVGGRTCETLEDYVVKAGVLVYIGPYQQHETSIAMGSELQVSITGTGLEDQDRLAIMSSCTASSNYKVARTDSGYTYNFGVVTEQLIPPGQYSFCWCRSDPKQNCSLPEHWMLVGYLQVSCTGDNFNNAGVCTRCSLPWDGPDKDKTGCEMYPERALSIVGANLCLMLACFLLSIQIEITPVARAGGKTGWRVSGRRLSIEDISVEGEGDRLVVTTLGSHFLRSGTTFKVHFTYTNHYLLDGQYKRATVIDASRLELRDLDEGFFAADASGGFFVLSILSTFWYSQIFAYLPLMLFCAALLVCGSTALAFTPPYPVAVMIVTIVQIALVLMFRAFWKSRRLQTPLQRRLRQYIRMIESQNPHPRSCARGPSRAVTAFRLFELYEFFQAFIKFRTMYYIDPNLVRPITKKHKLSFAERVGPQQVQFFISHWWGTPFVHFCESVRRHAVQISGSEDESTWKLVSYWICTFSNNQYRVKEELGTYHKDSSFYLALHSGICKGTAMIMDERASLLNRSWCLFELLQTVTLEKTQENFAGLYFCTPTGVLNNGHATVELAMNIGKHITGLSLQNATATSQEDKDMINQLVLEEMGSFHRIDRILRKHLATALKTCQSMVDEQFDGLFAELEGNEPEETPVAPRQSTAI